MIRRLLDSPWLYFGGAALLLAFLLLRVFSPPGKPGALAGGRVADLRGLAARQDVSVLFILVDTLRADHMSAYGYERPTSPRLAALSRQGIRFAHVESQSSWTKASMASLWTASYPRRSGVLNFRDSLPLERELPAEHLRDAGFRTGGIYRNGWVDPVFGFGQGFDLYVHPKEGRVPARLKRRPLAGHRPLSGSDVDVTDSALEFLRAYGHERFFLYLHYMDLHQYLYDPEATDFGTERSDAYDGAIAWTDREIGRLIDGLSAQGLRARTLVVFASDHGEAFFEHGAEGHGQNVYTEVTGTPLVVLPPFDLSPGLVVEPRVRNIDVWPTVFDLLGLPPLPDADGQSLLPLIESAATGGSEHAPERSFAEIDKTWGRSARPKPEVAVVEGPFRLIYRPHQPRKPELYDHRTDPGEQVNVAERYPERVKALTAEARAYLALEPARIGAPVELGEMRRNQLRALGYMIE